MVNKLSKIIELTSESSSLDFKISERIEVAKKEVIRLSGLITLFELTTHSPVIQEISRVRDDLFDKYFPNEKR